MAPSASAAGLFGAAPAPAPAAGGPLAVGGAAAGAAAAGAAGAAAAALPSRLQNRRLVDIMDEYFRNFLGTF